jgi:uncharacterized protein
MSTIDTSAWIAFSQNTNRCIASGSPREVVTEVKHFVERNTNDNVLIFDAQTSIAIEIDLRDALAILLRRLPRPTTLETTAEQDVPLPQVASVGRPRLGVTAREVTLLPRHWAWLATQPGGASVALRKLVEHASRVSKEADRCRQAQESSYRFMNAMAGDNPGYEEATRALFAGNYEQLQRLIATWPKDVGNHVLNLAFALTESPTAAESNVEKLVR